MIELFMCSIFYILIVLAELVPIYKSKEKKLFWLYLVIWATTYTVHVLFILKVEIPSPADPIREIIGRLVELPKP